MLECRPIGYYKSQQTEKYMAGKQAPLSTQLGGKIVLCAGMNYEQALEDLEGFDRIWIIYWFDRNESWKPKIFTPRGGIKRGVFSTRSPHRPNPIGLSCVELKGIQGLEILIGKADLINDTPILDIKPYINYADAFPNSEQGWIEKDVEKEFEVEWSPLAKEQAMFIEERAINQLVSTIEMRLMSNPYPFPNHRIRIVDDELYELAFKTWRICYSVVGLKVHIEHIDSGYDSDTLAGQKDSKWDDVPLHREFLSIFI